MLVGCEPIYDAYRDLLTCRNDGPIPWTAAMLWADRAGLEPDVADLMWSVVRKMDNAERKWALDNAPADSMSDHSGDDEEDA